MASFFKDFDGIADYTAPGDVGLTPTWDTTYNEAGVFEETFRLATDTSTSRWGFIWDEVGTQTGEVNLRAALRPGRDVSGAAFQNGFAIYGEDTSLANSSGLLVQIRRVASGTLAVQVASLSNNSATDLHDAGDSGEEISGIDFDADFVTLKVQVTPSQVRAKIWQADENLEPEVWQVEVSHSVSPSGFVGLYARSQNAAGNLSSDGSYAWDNLGFGNTESELDALYVQEPEPEPDAQTSQLGVHVTGTTENRAQVSNVAVNVTTDYNPNQQVASLGVNILSAPFTPPFQEFQPEAGVFDGCPFLPLDDINAFFATIANDINWRANRAELLSVFRAFPANYQRVVGVGESEDLASGVTLAQLKRFVENQ